MRATTSTTNRLRERRTARGLSQVALAAESKVGLATVCRAERWHFPVSQLTAVKLAAALRCEVYELFPYLSDKSTTETGR